MGDKLIWCAILDKRGCNWCLNGGELNRNKAQLEDVELELGQAKQKLVKLSSTVNYRLIDLYRNVLQLK